MTLKSMLALACAASTLAACQGGTIYRKDTFGDYRVLAVDARQRLVIQKGDGADAIICTEPSPDAIVAQAAQLAAAANGNIGAARTASAQLAGGFSESAASIAMRTQSIQLLRDGYFRLYEAYMNNVLPPQEYYRIIAFIDEFIATVVAIEAIGGTVVAAPVTVYASGNASTSVNKESAEQKIGGGGSAGEIKAKTDGLPAEKAAAIQAILAACYARKERFQAGNRLLGGGNT
jgi:hypothetical protein